MKFKGGYNVPLAGRPAEQVRALPEPSVLHLPLAGRRLAFTEVRVADGQRVATGDVLAVDPVNHDVPLLAPRAGTVRLTAPGHVTLANLAPASAAEPADDGPPPADPRARLLRLGAWQFISDAHTLGVPDPALRPGAVIVSTLSLEPFLARGDVQLRIRLDAFLRGLEHLQSMLEYEAIYLALPDVRSELARTVRQRLRGLAWVNLLSVPLRYPFDDFRLLARALGVKRDADRPAWGVRTEGVLAIEEALSAGRPAIERLIALGGPGVKEPVYLRALAGYPLADLLRDRLNDGPMRVVLGGCLTGVAADVIASGLPADCAGLTVIPEQTEREFLTFFRPGFARPSYSRCYASVFRRRPSEAMTTSRRGDERACIGCALCERVCPVGIMPHLIHKHLYAERLEQAERAGAGLCVGCGLCSYVCPSKIELREQIEQARSRIAVELHGGTALPGREPSCEPAPCGEACGRAAR